jgi:predicted nuclease of predicted toxin-antitoxin system
MGNKIKFHLDENVSYSIALGLRHRSLDVTITPEENLLGVSDEIQLQFASSNGRVIFTQDTDFLKPSKMAKSNCLNQNNSQKELK